MRQRILDSIEAMGNLVALNSHIRELREDEDSDELKMLYDLILLQRRELQALVEKNLDADDKYHCAFKHAMGYYIYANELEDADPIFEGYGQKATDMLNIILSQMTGQEITLCSRCLADKLLSQNKE